MLLLSEFIRRFVKPETLIRLLYEVSASAPSEGPSPPAAAGILYQEVLSQPVLEWGLKASAYYQYAEVLYVTDILYPPGNFPEAVNIVIKRPE